MTDILRYAAFTTDPSGGNPAGVVLDAAGLSDAGMLAVAAEVGYSETAFVTERDGNSAVLRYFSPLAEVPFCGHATVATAVALGEGEHLFRTNAGVVPVVVDGSGRATLTSVDPKVEDLTPGDLEELLRILGYGAPDLDASLPPKVAYAGAFHPILALSTRAKLTALDYDVRELKNLMTDRDWTTIQLVHRAADDVFDVRDPFPVGGVYEDPATGAAAAALGGYLRELRLVPDDAVLTLRQGDDMGRPSRITVTLVAGEGGVRVSGNAVPMPE